ncbi:MAG: hypothetical protein LiPW15_245 [Parcubacteria group bacterium LiPW_15]|nr:MAG: hypothetical protein LiPW15_245 [Parcubacteria group bacterium LiPW_15]
MFTFIITNIFLISLAAILFMVARVLPRIETPAEEIKQSPLEKWVTSGVPEKVDAVLNAFFAKFLRRAKVVIMRVDNSVTNRLQNFAKKEGNGKPKPDFKEITGEKPQEENETASI